MLSANDGSPVLVKDVATVETSYEPRLGIAGQDDNDDIVQGIVLMRRGEQTTPTIHRVEAEMDKINISGILPAGVRLERIYDRSGLIGLTTEKVVRNLILGVCLVFAVQWLFLGDLRSAIVVSATIPFALSFAIIILTFMGESANPLILDLSWSQPSFWSRTYSDASPKRCGRTPPTHSPACTPLADSPENSPPSHSPSGRSIAQFCSPPSSS